MAIYVPYCIQLAGASAVRIGGITNISLPRNLDIAADVTAGSPFTRFTSVRSERPMVSITTLNVQAALGLVGSTALAIKSGGTYTGLEVFYAALDDCGRIASGSVHVKIAFSKGCLVPRVLSGSAAQDAQLTLEFMALSTDGVTSPIAETGSQALPTLPTEERFVIGPMTLESISIDRLQQFSLDFGNTVTAHQLDSAVYPTHISVDSQVPRLTFTGLGLNLFDASIEQGGLEITHNNTEIWFRQRKIGATALEADTAEKHLKLTMDGLAVIDDPLSATNAAAATISGSVTGKYDGTNAPVTITANQAISV